MTITVVGEVQRVVFENEDTGFRVLRLRKVEGYADHKPLTAVGIVQAVGPGTRVRLSGRLEQDPKFGERLRMQSLVVLAPDTIEGVEKYLASGVVSGVGPGFAKRIVKYFGMETLTVLDTAPHRLAEVPGLGASRVEEIRNSWIEHHAASNVMLALQAHGASPGLASRIIKRFGERAAEIVQNSPYRLAIEVRGVGFKTADRMARSRGLSLDHPERAQAGIMHQLRDQAEEGHCCVPQELLVARTADMLEIDAGHVAAAVDALWASEHVVVEEEFVYLERLHRAERAIAAALQVLLAAPSHEVTRFEQSLAHFEATQKLALADGQRRAVEAAVRGKVSIITGGPGVGKTTIVRAILATLGDERLRVSLAAPTGRAAKRLKESTGHQASTIHRLLEVNAHTGRFERNRDKPLEVDLLIVDEASMIDVLLAQSLVEALPPAARLVLVGDADQLPSVGPGAFLLDLIDSGVIDVARLDVVFRQQGESGIIDNAHRVLGGEVPVGADDPDADFFWIGARDPRRAAELVTKVVTERIPQRFSLDPQRDVQVLTPMHRGDAGTRALNQALQAALNPRGEELVVGETTFRTGDKVLQLKNDYDRGVFNGDVGEVVAVDTEASTLRARFEDDRGSRLVDFERGHLAQLGLAYAMSIHKSQGSEYPAVVVVFLSAHFVMLSRNLLYTALTRGKKLCVLVADDRAVRLALAETRREQRHTRLASRLRYACQPRP